MCINVRRIFLVLVVYVWFVLHSLLVFPKGGKTWALSSECKIDQFDFTD